jgi:lathosterol oxidase
MKSAAHRRGRAFRACAPWPTIGATMMDWLHDTTQALGNPALWRAFRRVFLDSLLDEGWRYALFALLIWGLLHVLLRKRLAHRLIVGWPTRADLRRELTYSLSTLAVFAAISAAVLALMVSGVAEIYDDPLKHGLAWLVLSLPLLIVWHDAYFYWTHRLLHTRWLFRHVHGVHHRSRNPSPFAAYAFHPAEALVNGLPVLLPLLVLPLNLGVVLAFSVHQVVRNAHGHAAVEVMPRGFARHWLWGRFTTTTHHHLHHETAQGNYGLWFTWWDRWCGTDRKDYLQRYAAASQPRAPAS